MLAFLALSCLQSVPARPAPVAFVGVHVLPMDSERVLRDQTVVCADGRITAVGAAHDVAVPAGATRIEGHGRFLIPGLVDSHVHCLDEGDLLVYLAHGVTTVRNLKGNPWHLELRERIASGELLGPRFLTAGPFVNEPDYKTPADVQRAVSEQVAAGYDCIKIHGDLSLAAYGALLEEAALAEIPVIGHVPRNLPLERVLERPLERGRQREISHAEEYLYTYFDLLPKDADVGAATAEIAAATSRAGVTVTPNLVAFRSIVRQIEDLERELARPEVAYVAPPVGRGWKPDLNRYRRAFKPEDAASMSARYRLLERLTRALADAHVRLLAGSDAMNPTVVPGVSLHEELELLVAAGLTPFQALRAATANAGEFLGNGAGIVAPGAPADLVLLAENPLEGIARTRAIEGVLANGRWLAKEELARGLAQRAQDYAREADFIARIAPTGIDAAIEYARAARAKDAHAFVFRPEALESLVLVYAGLQNPAVARKAAEYASAEFPSRWTAWTSLARALALHPHDARIERELAALAK